MQEISKDGYIDDVMANMIAASHPCYSGDGLPPESHSWEDGKCQDCGVVCDHDAYHHVDDGFETVTACTRCGLVCVHDSFDVHHASVQCRDCGEPLPHLEPADLDDRDNWKDDL